MRAELWSISVFCCFCTRQIFNKNLCNIRVNTITDMLWCTTIRICSKAVTPWIPWILEGANGVQKHKYTSNAPKSQIAAVQNAQNFFKSHRVVAKGISKNLIQIRYHKSMIQEVWEILTARGSDCQLASKVQGSLRFLFTLGLIFFSKCSLSAQRSWACCFLFFPSSSLAKARSILLPTVRFLSSPGSSWRGWGLSLLLLLLL